MVHGTRLVDKMVAAHRRLWLVLETLYLAVHGMDRYLATIIILGISFQMELLQLNTLILQNKQSTFLQSPCPKRHFFVLGRN